MEKTISPLALALIENDAARVAELLRDPRTSTEHCLKLGQSALRFALRKEAPVAVIAALAESPRTPARELASCLDEVKQSFYEDRAYAYRLARLLEHSLRARLGTAPAALAAGPLKDSWIQKARRWVFEPKAPHQAAKSR